MLTHQSRLRDFPTLRDKSYLNSAAESIPPLAVHEALDTYWRDKTLGMKGRDFHFAELEHCRVVAANLLDKKPGEVSFCSCSSEAYNLLASALDLRPGDEVVISDLDFPAGATPWFFADHNGGKGRIRVWEKNEHGVPEISSLEKLLSAKTRLVQVSLVSFLTGYRLPWAPFRDAVRALAPNATLAVDITQGFGRVELDCLDADCLISSTHKWILGIHGGCVVAIPERAADRLTAKAGGWFHLENAFAPDRFSRAVPKRGAASFSVGMPNFAAIYALRAGMEYLQNIGIGPLSHHADAIVSRLHSKLADLGFRTMAPPQSECSAGIVALQHERDTEIHAALLARDIHVMAHAGRLRIAVHGYNQTEDIDRFIEVLAKWA